MPGGAYGKITWGKGKPKPGYRVAVSKSIKRKSEPVKSEYLHPDAFDDWLALEAGLALKYGLSSQGVYDLRTESARFFDESSVCKEGKPECVLIAGGVASGKTRLRKEKYAVGYVLVDAAEIFRNLSGDGVYDFPSKFETGLECIGQLVAHVAIYERRHIVTEIIGSEEKPTMELIEAMKAAGYKVKLVGVTCDIATALEQNVSRGPNNISAYYAEPYQRRWLIDAAKEYVKRQSEQRND